MLRTAYSQILNSSRDFSTAICDLDGRLIAQAEHVPIHVGALPLAARVGDRVLQGRHPSGRRVPAQRPVSRRQPPARPDRLRAGVRGRRPRFWSINRAHQSDIGGATHGAYNAGATEIWQEGIRITPLKLYDRGELRDDVLQMIATNVRHPRDFRGDLRGDDRLGACRRAAPAGAGRRVRLRRRCIEAIEASPRRRRAPDPRGASRDWKDGVYQRRGVPRRRRPRHPATSTSAPPSPSRASDLDRRSHRLARAGRPASSTRPTPTCMSAVLMALAYLIDPRHAEERRHLPAAEGDRQAGHRGLGQPGAPVTLCTNHCAQEIIEAIIKALAPACPDRAMAGWGAALPHRDPGHEPAHASGQFIWHLFQARPGGGASSAGDGWPGAGEWQAAGGIKFGSLEVTEARFPLFFKRHEFRPDSGGDGRFRGGPGGLLELAIETDEPALGNTAGDGVRHGACGMLGRHGRRCPIATCCIARRKTRVLKTKEAGIADPPGRLFLVESAAAAAGATRRGAPPTARAADPRQRLRLRPPAAREGLRCCASASTSAAPSPTWSRSTTRAASTLAKVGLHAGRPIASACWTGWRCWPPSSAPTGRPARARPTASCTARRSPPTRCSNARAPASAC